MEKSNLIALSLMIVIIALVLLTSKFNMEKQYEIKKNTRLLPYWAKYLGFIIFIVSLITHLVSFSNDLQTLKPFWQITSAIGCIIIGLSREKNEDEMTMALRLNSVFKAFFGGIIFHLFMLSLEKLIGGDLNSYNSLYVTNFILVTYVINFHIAKKRMKA
ncbi:hypothetical protein [Plebeiibacterium sediminum]|uniref:Uncharacterized protein n=1 Tax=Plebeiibacterium sediminum TaxID=2992112 RepID=A0AAE3SG70_9BACT|nr:hypothetical protein [Plebeiobacterium sediminum]MCW3786993.1 hypothetical protein [Plebeiobacterium sediminum]